MYFLLYHYSYKYHLHLLFRPTAEYIHLLNERKAKILLSNSDPKNHNEEDNFFDDLYANYNIKRIEATRMINSKSTGRGKIKELLIRSREKIDKISVNFKDISLIQIMSGYETKTSCSVLESNLVETGLAAPVIHDKGSFCHGRSNLLFQYPDSHVIYLCHQRRELDNILIELINREYSNISIFDTEDITENYFWKEYYLILQMYFLSKKIADDKSIDLTQPEYNPKLVKKLYNFRGEM